MYLCSSPVQLLSRGLVGVPEKVWTIGELDQEEQRKVSQVTSLHLLYVPHLLHAPHLPSTPGEHGLPERGELVGPGGHDQGHPRLQQDLRDLAPGDPGLLPYP